MEIHEPAPYVRWWDTERKEYVDTIYDRLADGLQRKLDIDVYLRNDLLPPDRLHEEADFLPGLRHVLPGMRLDELTGERSLDLYTPQHSPCTLNSFIDLASEFFESLHARRIGVHLSGGLDSSIIICLLKKLGIDFVPIGFESQTFEFRTERRIQQLLAPYGSDSELIDLENITFYSGLDSIPPHQKPLGTIKSYNSTSALVQAFARRGCDVVLTGQGGDSLFVDPVDNPADLSFNIGNEFDNPEENELYYRPHGIRLISFYGQKRIIDAISTASAGRKTDPLKTWAREWFSPILPLELSRFTYAADFLGLTMWGLDRMRPVMRKLFRHSFEVTGSHFFSPEETDRFVSSDIFSFEYRDYIRFCSLLSIAVWHYSLRQLPNEK